MKPLPISLVLLYNLLSTVSGTGPAALTLYFKNENRSITLHGDRCEGGVIFDSQNDFSCVCITGLWLFYQQDCTFAHAILGATNGQCFNLDFQVHKVSLISPMEETPSTSSAVVLDQSMSSIGGKFITAKEIPKTVYFVPPGFPVLITTGLQSWRIPHKKLCLKPFSLDSETKTYCVFKHSISEEYRLIDEDCSDEDEIISPFVCTPYLKDEDNDVDSCITGEVTPRRTRREANVLSKITGRVYLGAVAGLNENANGNLTGGFGNITDVDENHGLSTTIDRPIMNSEIWNFITFRAQLRLGIREPKAWDKSSLAYSPAFEFLEVAKQIQQKACPDHYVTDEHYDISIGAFESLQKNYLRYMDVFVDFATSERIMDALYDCLNNITTYPFLERMGKEGVSCNGSSPVTHGSYEMFDQILELSLGHDQASRSNEPIVETAWKVFVHAHSACFPYFKNSFNDHHRFTTIMLPLFTNDVNDMWFSVTELKPDIYAGFLGDAIDLMDSVAYCAMFSRLGSAYPWDLPRPKKDNERRKREISERFSAYDCLHDYDAKNICPMTEYSLPISQDDDQVSLSDNEPSISSLI